MDETAQFDETAPAAPKEVGPGEAERPSLSPDSPAEPPVAEISPPAASSSPDPAREPAGPLPEEAMEPIPVEPVAAAPSVTVAPEAEGEAEGIAKAIEPPATLAAPASVIEVAEAAPTEIAIPHSDEPEDEPQALDAATTEAPPAERIPETATPPSLTQVVPPLHEAEAPPQEWDQSEVGVEAEAGGEKHAPLPEAPPADAWAAQSPSLPPLAEPPPPTWADIATVSSAPSAGAPESDNRAPDAKANASLLSAPGPDRVPSEPPEARDALVAPVPHAMRPADPESRREEVSEGAQPPPSKAVPVLTEAPGEAFAPPHHEPPLPEVQDVAAGVPDVPAVPAQPASLDASVPAAAWTPVEATPAPEPSAQPLPAWLPLPLPPESAARELPRLRRGLPYLGLALRGTALVAVGLVVSVLTLVVLYRWVNPPISTLMVGRILAGTAIERTWVPLDRISPNLMRAVILSEDGGFCRHGGVDWAAIEEAIEGDRGGSTITMQLVKNLFLWPSRSYVRKAIEIGLAYLVEALWPKRRILEIYLNVAEWGDGVFGAEAAAQTHFGKRAARLTAEEAALLAAALPNPIERTAGAPSLMTGRLASRLLTRMRTSRADLSCVPVPRMEPRKAPQKSPQRTPEKAPLVQGPRMTL